MLVVLMCAVLVGEEPAGGQRATAEQIRFYETSIRPLLAEQCLKCHGDKKQWGGLRLDLRAALLKGGDSGAAIVPGKPDKSLLIRAVRQLDDDLTMPPEDKLTKRQIAALVRWVKMGAPFPAATVAVRRTRDPNHWAFQPPAKPPVPPVTNSKWPQSALDHFIVAKLEAAGLSPSTRADKRTLIRRVTFDLIGLPPTPEEIDAFLADDSPSAFARLAC